MAFRIRDGIREDDNDAPYFSNPHGTSHIKTHAPLPRTTRYTNVIFDLGDVLFTYSTSSSKSPIPHSVLKRVLRSSTWFEYEKGNLTEDETYNQVAEEYNLFVKDVACAFAIARESLKSNLILIDTIRGLRATGHRVFAMSNMSAPDWEVVMKKLEPSQWALFEEIFISAKAHERKPHMGFYRHVLLQTGIDPARTIFVDDKIENVVTARSFGMHGIVFDNTTNALQQLKCLQGDSVELAKSFLHANRKTLASVTSSGIVLQENYSQLLIQETTDDKFLVDINMSPQFSNFFPESYRLPSVSGVFWKEHFPADLDTASIALTVAKVEETTKHRVMDEMLSFRDHDGIIQVYFDHTRPRLDPVVCINVLTLFYRNGRGHELESTLDWVYSCLLFRAYTDGTLYYTTAETFLFFLSRLMQSSPSVQRRFKPVYRARVMERFELGGDALALAMRILAAASVGLVCHADVQKLASMQRDDGSWTTGWIYKLGSSGMLIANHGLTTALAMKAIQAAEAASDSSSL